MRGFFHIRAKCPNVHHATARMGKTRRAHSVSTPHGVLFLCPQGQKVGVGMADETTSQETTQAEQPQGETASKEIDWKAESRKWESRAKKSEAANRAKFAKEAYDSMVKYSKKNTYEYFEYRKKK